MNKGKYLILGLIVLTLTGCQKSYDLDFSHQPAAHKEAHQTELQAFQDELAALSTEDEEYNDKALSLHLDIAVKYGALGLNDNALESYQEALSIAPDSFLALNNTMSIYKEGKSYEEAKKYIDKMYVLKPENGQMLIDYVNIYSELGDYDTAKKAVLVYEESEVGQRNPEFVKRLKDDILDIKKRNR